MTSSACWSHGIKWSRNPITRLILLAKKNKIQRTESFEVTQRFLSLGLFYLYLRMNQIKWFSYPTPWLFLKLTVIHFFSESRNQQSPIFSSFHFTLTVCKGVKLDLCWEIDAVKRILDTISSVQSLSHFWSFATPWTAAHQASLSFTISLSLLKLMSIQLVMPSPSSIIPFSFCLQSFPASGSFPMRQFFASGGQSIGASALASVIPMNIQDSDTIWAIKQNNRIMRFFSQNTCVATTNLSHSFFSSLTYLCWKQIRHMLAELI